MIFKDYYAILELPADCDLSEIKRSYRRLAKQWHPDKNPEIDTNDQIRDIIEANLILSDSEARSRYDVEYVRFKAFTWEAKSESVHETSNPCTIEDEILERWIRNARDQSERILKELLTELRESFSTGINGALKGMSNFIQGKKWI